MSYGLARSAIVCGAVFLWASSFAAHANGHDPAMQGDHYVCYDVIPETKSRPVDVTLEDQFQKLGTSVARVVSICAPASNNGAPVRNEKLHMVCYEIENRQAKPVDRLVKMTNQFGKLRYRIKQAATLCVPSFKKVLK
jgi:hypothetical protein